MRRISPASPVIAERGTTRCTPLEARTRRPGRTPTSLSIVRHVVAPHAGRGDDRAGPHLELRASPAPPGRAPVRRSTSRASPHEADDPGAGHHGRAEAGRGAGQGDHQAGVVDLPVVVADRAGERVRRAGSGRAAGRRRGTGAGAAACRGRRRRGRRTRRSARRRRRSRPRCQARAGSAAGRWPPAAAPGSAPAAPGAARAGWRAARARSAPRAPGANSSCSR